MIDKRQGLTLAILLSLVAAACVAPPTRVPTGKLKVVATFSVLGDLVQNVGGDKIELHTLVAPGVDTHTFEPSPADNRTLAEASLVFENGLGFETWLDDLYTSSGSKAERVAVSDGIEPLKVEGDDRSEFDPHVWHGAANAIQMTRNIRDALAKADALAG
ncbi:MAG TPA: zinc ABC transporter substrate-binding protein, partial [Anaerolineales bacterium]|nr:zinc ABC transporter substrate-binding protein [Anaerolineales bacterium]